MSLTLDKMREVLSNATEGMDFGNNRVLLFHDKQLYILQMREVSIKVLPIDEKDYKEKKKAHIAESSDGINISKITASIIYIEANLYDIKQALGIETIEG